MMNWVWAWDQFMRDTANRNELTVAQKEVFLLIQKDFHEYKQLRYLVEKELTIVEDTLRKRMKDIYDTLEIGENGKPYKPNKFKLLMKKLNSDFSEKFKSFPLAISAEDTGITQIYPSFPREKFKQALQRVINKPDAKYKKVESLQTFAPNLNDFKSELIECISHGVSVCIILSWPLSTVAKLREEALNKYTLGSHDESINFKHEIIKNLQTLESILKSSRLKKPERLLQVRLYDTIPSIPLYRAGNYLLSSYFLPGELAINNVQFEINIDANNPLVIDSFQTLYC